VLDHWRQSSTPKWSQNLFILVLCSAGVGIGAILFVIRPVLGRDPRSSPLVLVLGMPLLSVAFAALIGLLVLRSDSPWWLSKLLRARIFQLVGTISYTMYLVHLIAAAIVRLLFHGADVYRQTFLQAVLSTVLTIAMAQLSWIFFEKKFLHWKDRHFPNIPHPPEPNVPWLGDAL